MNRKLSFVLISILSFSTCGCNSLHETPTLIEIEESKDACKNLVIFIGDGMGPEHIKAAELSYDTTYDFTSWKHTYSDTYSYESFTDDYVEITDSAAGGTAIATGEVTINGYVGKDHNGKDLATIFDYAKKLGKSVGVVTTDTIIGATPSDFTAHAINRSLATEIINTQITSNTDLFIGQYSSEIEERKSDIESEGYSYYTSYESIENINKQSKAWCQFAFEENGGEVSLKQAVEVATSFLSKNKKGYVLMVEQAHIDKYSHNNDFIPMVQAVNSLNETVEYVTSIANNDTGIIITADHETGCLSVSSEAIYPNKYENTYYLYYSSSHTGKAVPVYIYGFDVDFKEYSLYKQDDLIKNKDIFKIALNSIAKVL